MARFPSMKSRDLLGVLNREPLAYRIDRQKGSHMRLVSDNGYPPLTFASHAGAELPATLGVMIAMKVVVPEAEARDPILIDVDMAGPDLQPAMPHMEMTLRLGDRSPNLPDGWEEHTAAFVFVTWTASVPGNYGLVLAPREGDKSQTVDLIVRDMAENPV